jgi:hypothetical protein
MCMSSYIHRSRALQLISPKGCDILLQQVANQTPQNLAADEDTGRLGLETYGSNTDGVKSGQPQGKLPFGVVGNDDDRK